MTAGTLYYCPHPGCTFRHTCLVTLAEHKQQHTNPVEPQPEPEDK